VRERTPDIRLEQHDHGEYDVAKEIADQPVDGFEMPPLGSVEQRDDDAGAGRHLDRARAFDQLEDFVDQHDRTRMSRTSHQLMGGRRKSGVIQFMADG
jgi:hypothetical protein